MVYIYILLVIIFIILICALFLLFDIQMKLIDIDVRTTTTRNIVTNWAIYYVVEEYHKGNNVPFDIIFPNDREEMEKLMRQEECHIDNEKE